MEEFVLVAIALVAIVVGSAVGIGVHQGKKRKAYREALDALRSDPTNPDRKEAALAAGREYAGACRMGGMGSVFDEVALGNDIAAACAGASKPPQANPGAFSRLTELDDLRRAGLVTEEEYQQQRKAIIDSL